MEKMVFRNKIYIKKNSEPSEQISFSSKTHGNWISLENMQTNMKVGLIALFQVCKVHFLVFGGLANLVLNKLAKPGDAIAISKSETITHSLSDWQG